MMVKKLFIAGLIVGVLGMDAFGQAKAPPAQPKPENEGPPAMAVPPNYKYDTKGRRDPFLNPVPKPPKPEPEIPVVRPPGLKGVLLSEAAIAGIVSSKDPEMNRVVLTAPSGRTYFASKGDNLFDAVIKEIQRDGVVFEVRSRGLDGKSTTREVVRKIRPTP